MHCQKSKKETLISLRKAKSLTEKVIEMTEEDQYCVDIMQQNLAVIGLLRSAHHKLLDDHLKNCFRDAFESSNTKKQEEMIDEIIKVSKIANK